MSSGGQADFRLGTGAKLIWAHQVEFTCIQTGWAHYRHPHWIFDYLYRGRLSQRVGRGKAFTRFSGVAGLYQPGCAYHEQYEHGSLLKSSYIRFVVNGKANEVLRRLTKGSGWCNIRDPDKVIEDRLQRIVEEWRQRQPNYELFTQGLFLELLGWLTRTQPVGPNQRLLRLPVPAMERQDLSGRVESFIRSHVAEPLHVADLAQHVGLSVSALTHTYPALAGESPYQTIQRIKLEAAKRLLSQDRLSVKEVASRLSFSSEFHFSRLFKRLEGIAPQEYRRLVEKFLRSQPLTAD